MLRLTLLLLLSFTAAAHAAPQREPLRRKPELGKHVPHDPLCQRGIDHHPVHLRVQGRPMASLYFDQRRGVALGEALQQLRIREEGALGL